MEDHYLEIILGLGLPLINFIVVKIYNYFNGENKNFFWRNKYKSLSNLTVAKDFDSLKRITRIIVIDDEDSFPINLFQSEGYAIERWHKVVDYNKLEKGFYDIIILDIKGVAMEISDDDGLGVLKSIKKKNPAQIIIAYSQHTFDLSKAKFWELADEKIAKPSDFLKIKEIVDSLIVTKFVPDRYITTLHSLLKDNGFSVKEIKKIDNEIVKTVKNNSASFNWPVVMNLVKNRNTIAGQVISIGNTILKFYQK